MKKGILILCLLLSLPLMAGIHSYTAQSVLSEGQWVKIRVNESGICRMSFDEISRAGLDPNTIHVYGYGGAQKEQDFSIPNIDDLPQVPVYKGDGFILFYVQGPVSWTYNTSAGRFVHTRNTYSDFGYYFLTNSGEDYSAPTSADTYSTATDVTTYLHYQVQDKDSVNLIDRTGVSGGGRYFYGEQFGAGKTRTFSFPTPNAVTTENTTIVVDVAANAPVQSYFNISLNGTATKSLSIAPIPDHYTFGCTNYTTLTTASTANQQQVRLQLQNSNSAALGWLNYIEVFTLSELVMTGDYMDIRSTANLGSSSKAVRFHLSGANANTIVWDITDLGAIRRAETTWTDNELTWVGSQQDGIRQYIAVNTAGSKFVQATVIGNVANQNLHALSDIDYMIICPEGYETIAQDLAQAHQAKQGITWAVVTDQQVYNEFSSGTPDASAYRWIMKMLYDRANSGQGQKPRWLLLMGHGTYDNRKYFANSGTNLLLTYQSKNSVNEVQAYATDDYFGWLDDNEGTNDIKARMDIGVGRLPVNNEQEARTTVDKIIGYMTNAQTGKWKNQVVFLADDGENGLHTETAEQSAEMLRLSNPDFVVHKIFLDAYPQEVNASGESYPLAKNRVLNILKSGAFLFDYSGHGGYNAITSESILNMKDIESMNNKNLGFWIFVTCNFAQFDGGKRCAAETAVLNPNGAAVGILAATRTVYASQNTNLNRAVNNALFAHDTPFAYEATLGEAIARGKNSLNDGRDNGNKLAYVLLGDPALRLNFPTDLQVHTVTQMDTLNALSIQQVEGQIIDQDSAVVSDFNGKVDITIYDKLQVIPTRDNDNVGGDQRVVNYNDYPSTIFSGQTSVKDGLFRYTFMVPKDIRYNFGNGRIVYYAVSSDSADVQEAVGHFEQFVIGGSGSIVSVDTVGPEMTIWLNTPVFQNGDRTYPTPRFFAQLQDEHGINTAGAGIGHDLMLTVDDDPKQIYVLNDYFTAANNSYQEGQVSYLMESMPDGPHSLTFRAWDLLNNSTTKSLNFIVESGLDPSIYSVTTYPNPVKQYGVVNLIVNYDQPDEMLSTEVYLFNANGQMVYSHQQDNPDEVSINIPALGLQPGVYVYTVKIHSASSKYSTTSGKIIVTN